MKVRSNILVTVVATLLSFLSVTYISCKKNSETFACNNVVCKNNSYCSKGVCVCPSGYIDSACGTAFYQRYLGTWNVKQTIIGSDSLDVKGQDSTFVVKIIASATPTSFFINNWLGNREYNNVIGVVDTTLNNFTFNQYQPVVNNGYNITGGKASIDATHHTITGTYTTFSLNSFSVYQHDTFSVVFTYVSQ